MKYKFSIIILIIFSNTGFAQTWQSMGSGLDRTVRTIVADTINNILYAGGTFMTAGDDTVACLARWDSSGWSEMDGGGGVPNGLGGLFCHTVYALTMFKDTLYAIAGFSKYDVSAFSFAKWNGTTWDSIAPITGTCRGFYEHNDTLYILGENLATGNIYGDVILGWDGTNWFPVINETFDWGWVKTAKWYKGKLYIGGNFKTTSGIDDFAVWDGNTLQVAERDFSGGSTAIGELEIFQDKLYVAGVFEKINGDPGDNIALWDGENWSEIGGTTGNPWGTIIDLKIYNNYIFITGEFTSAGNITTSRIARWDGQQWCGYDEIFEGYVYDMAFYKDSLVISIPYGTIDGANYNRIAIRGDFDIVDTCGAILISNTTSLKKEVIEISIYPNPTQNQLTLSTAKPLDEIRIYNQLGQLIKQESRISSNQVSIDVSGFSSGIYVVQVRQGAVWQSERFVKE